MESKLIDFFDGRARHYERILSLPFFKALEKDEVAKIMRLIDAKDKTVLDIGCGPGKFCKIWASQGARLVVGIDFSHEMIRLARDKCGPNFLLGDAFNLPFPDDSFDLVSCVGLANYYKNSAPLLNEITRVGKEFLATFPQESMMGKIYRRISPVDIHLRTKAEVNKLIESHSSDFSVEECALGLTLLVRGRG